MMNPALCLVTWPEELHLGCSPYLDPWIAALAYPCGAEDPLPNGRERRASLE
jgi:hypothetical protein